MVGTVSRGMKHLIAVPYGCYKLATSKRSILRQSGWFDSVRDSGPVSNEIDEEGVPWMNYAVVKLIDKRLNRTLRLFEYGSGHSTRYFSRRVKEIVSVEYDRDWYRQITENRLENVSIIFQPFEDIDAYARTITQDGGVFDVVVVDGQHRVQCVQAATDCMSEQAVLLLDDSDRKAYEQAFRHLEMHGFRHLSISGIKPGSPCCHETTIFYRDGNCFQF